MSRNPNLSAPGFVYVYIKVRYCLQCYRRHRTKLLLGSLHQPLSKRLLHSEVDSGRFGAVVFMRGFLYFLLFTGLSSYLDTKLFTRTQNRGVIEFHSINTNSCVDTLPKLNKPVVLGPFRCTILRFSLSRFKGRGVTDTVQLT